MQPRQPRRLWANERDESLHLLKDSKRNSANTTMPSSPRHGCASAPREPHRRLRSRRGSWPLNRFADNNSSGRTGKPDGRRLTGVPESGSDRRGMITLPVLPGAARHRRNRLSAAIGVGADWSASSMRPEPGTSVVVATTPPTPGDQANSLSRSTQVSRGEPVANAELPGRLGSVEMEGELPRRGDLDLRERGHLGRQAARECPGADLRFALGDRAPDRSPGSRLPSTVGELAALPGPDNEALRVHTITDRKSVV